MLRNETEIAELKNVCRRIRLSIINTTTNAGVGHTGGSLSEVEILAALYFHIMRIDPSRPSWPQRDRFTLSKGHASPGYYCTLANRGFFAEEQLAEFDAIGSMLQGHPCMRKTPGVDMSTGSLGQGIYAAIAESATTARLHWVINRANILCMGAWVVGPYVARDMVDAWLGATIGEGFSEERRRVQAEGYARIQQIEAENFK